MLVTGSKTSNYILSIRIKADGFSFLVTEGHSGDTLLCTTFTKNEGASLGKLLEEKLKIEEIREYAFKRVRVILYTAATCVPQQEFCLENISQVYSYVFPEYDKQQFELGYTHLPQLDLVEIFLIPTEISQVVRTVYPDAVFTNASAVILGRILTYCKRNQLPDNSLFAYVTPLQLFLFSVEQDNLKFANTFPLDYPQDSLYFLLSVWKSLKLSPTQHCCYVAGENGSVYFLIESLKSYLRKVEAVSISLED